MVPKKKIILTFLVMMALIIPGCRSAGAPTYHMSENIDFSFYKRVAVMPLDNFTNDKFAGDIVRQVVISELLASGLMEVVVPGEVLNAFKDLGIKSAASLTTEQIKSLGEFLSVEAIIMGSVEEYGEAKMGNVSAPQVTMSLMMADSDSGSIVWSITATRGGAGFMARHFGARHETISETVIKLVREAIQTLGQ